jgi:hypothetical protein
LTSVVKVRQFGAALLLLALVSPAMACLLPENALTAEEHECCRKMANQCGSMRMASHSCCQQQVDRPHSFVAAKSITHFAPAVAVPLAPTNEPTLIDLSYNEVVPFASPPGATRSINSILRI